MATSKVALRLSIKVSVAKISNDACGLGETNTWFPLSPTVTILPPTPTPTVNASPVPPESAPIPAGFDYDSPNLCQIFDNILSETNDAIYAEELQVETIILPYNEIVRYYGLLRTYVNLFRYNYTLKSRISPVSLILKAKAIGIRIFKFKCEKGTFGLTGVDAKIYPTRKLIAASTSFVVNFREAAISPIRIFCDKGTFASSFRDAAIKIPGTFSYGWASTTSTSPGYASPITIGYRRILHQSLYSSSILLANGARTGAEFFNLRWYLTQAISSTYSILGMNIRLFHSTATNTNNALSPKTGETKTVVYSDLSTVEFTKAETVGVLQIDFLTNFVWDGVNSIVVEVCTSQNQTNYLGQGSVRNISTGSVNVRRYSWTDAVGSSCNDVTDNVEVDQISTQMDFR